MKKLFSDKNFEIFEETKYVYYAEWFADNQFEQVKQISKKLISNNQSGGIEYYKYFYITL